MEKRIGYYFKQISDKIKANADADLKRHGLTLEQLRVLEFLSSKGGMAGQKDIEEYLQVSHPTVAGLVSRMEQKGFVAIRHNPADRRANIVSLTDRAVAIGDEMDAIVCARDEKMLEGLSKEQRTELRKMLQTIYKNVD